MNTDAGALATGIVYQASGRGIVTNFERGGVFGDGQYGIATFPQHLENQVGSILSNKTRVFTSRLVKTGLGNSPLLETR